MRHGIHQGLFTANTARHVAVRPRTITSCCVVVAATNVLQRGENTAADERRVVSSLSGKIAEADCTQSARKIVRRELDERVEAPALDELQVARATARRSSDQQQQQQQHAT